jgi:hypothetical protein
MMTGLTFVSRVLTGDSKLYYSLSYWFPYDRAVRNGVWRGFGGAVGLKAYISALVDWPYG